MQLLTGDLELLEGGFYVVSLFLAAVQVGNRIVKGCQFELGLADGRLEFAALLLLLGLQLDPLGLGLLVRLKSLGVALFLVL